ncbi:co-chaperone YbbN [Vibrio metschnikovii]|uniref:co-chaperone YbbN n=1 Tax=Vibrio metschnikovii TaxID=28172 RepID=UPI001C3106DA|nr:co-chaperone YbbN [Vibrio metschnikovii]
MHPTHHSDVSQHNFQEILANSAQQPVLFYFWAPISDESAQLLPELQQLAQQYAGAFQLATLNCQQEQALAAQFGIQALPTIALFINGQPVDGLGGPQPLSTIIDMLDKHLPSQEERTVQTALQLVKQQDYTQALPLLLELSETWQSQGEIKLALADCFIATRRFAEAKTLLDTVPMQYQQIDYKRLLAQIELYEQAAESPAIKELEEALAQDSTNATIANELASQYHQVQRDEDALELLWRFLQDDLTLLDGEMKKTFMDILSALGQGNPIAARYRRQLYSQLY